MEAHALRAFSDPRSFLDRAGAFLCAEESRNNLILGLCRLYCEHGAPPRALFATVELDGEVRGCAFCTPPENLVLTSVPLEAVPAIEARVAEEYETLAGVTAAEPEALRFARLWAERRGVGLRERRRQGVYELTALTPPAAPAPGALRPATLADLPLIADWIAAFAAETEHPVIDAAAAARTRLERGVFWLWEDGEPVCMAGRMGRTPHGDRVGFVYTPPAHRGRGYASTCVAALTARILQEGLRFAALFTDLANPTSNAIYRQLGYRMVAQNVELVFVPRG